MYINASRFTIGLAITQYRSPEEAFVNTTSKAPVKVPILYDSQSLSRTQRLYTTYKKELYAIVTFASKYSYLCRHPFHVTEIHTDHRPLTHFLSSDLHEGIYGCWADKLRRLNVVIKYIPGPRNKVADGLSRTLFRNEECTPDNGVKLATKALSEQGPRWIWKDGRDGFESLLSSLSQEERQEVINQGTIDGIPVFSLDAVSGNHQPSASDTQPQQDPDL